MTDYVDLRVKTGNPVALDQIVQQWAAVVAQEPDGSYVPDHEGAYTVRCYGNAGFVQFAITNQGYGTIVGETRPRAAGEGRDG